MKPVLCAAEAPDGVEQDRGQHADTPAPPTAPGHRLVQGRPAYDMFRSCTQSPAKTWLDSWPVQPASMSQAPLLAAPA